MSAADLSTVTLSPEEQYNPQYCSLCDQHFFSIDLLRNHLNHSGVHPYCTTCRRGFLNNNSHRVHLVVSDYHHLCHPCGIDFRSAKALQIHNEQSVYHSPDFERGDCETRPDGWEEALAAELEREAMREDPIALEDRESMSRVEFGAALLSMKRRVAVAVPKPPPSSRPRRRCAVCLESTRRLSSTRCGHVYCSSCIKQTFEKNQGCPNCRTEGSKAQVRYLKVASH